MDELTADAESTGVMDRREALRRGVFVVGATALWTTPIVQTLGARAAVAGTGEVVSPDDLCPVGADGTAGQPSDLVFRYRARGDADDAAQPVNLRIGRTGIGGSSPDSVVLGLQDGETFRLTGRAGSQLRVFVTDTCDEDLESLTIHTSCSQPLAVGDVFGSLTLVGGRRQDGDLVGASSATFDVGPGQTVGTKPECLAELADPELEETPFDEELAQTELEEPEPAEVVETGGRSNGRQDESRARAQDLEQDALSADDAKTAADALVEELTDLLEEPS